MLKLRPYQEKLVADTRDAMKAGHDAVLAVLPTGGGKTVLSADLTRKSQEKGKTIWFLCHRDFLLHQTSMTFDQMELQHGFLAAGRPVGMLPTMICSVDTVKARLSKMATKPDLIIWDEAHHTKAAGWEKIRAWAGDKCKHIGLTATPQRLDGKGLNPPFTAMTLGPTTAELMAMGNLSKYRAFAPSKPDLSGVHTVAGDYNQRELQEAVEKSVITGDIVKTYLEMGFGHRGVYFCPSIKYSKALAQEFEAAGVHARHVDGETDTEDRIAAARMFAQGKLQILTNCSLFGEGYDLSAQAGMDATIELVGLVRPTQSLTLHLQQIGRCLRPKDYPAVILDHAGNLEEHGLPDEDRLWSLDGQVRNKASVRICKACQAANALRAIVCVCCGEPLAEKKGPRAGPEHVEGELVEVDVELLARRKRAELRDCRTRQDFADYAKRWGYKPGWVFHAWRGFQEAQRRGQERIEAQARAYLRR